MPDTPKQMPKKPGFSNKDKHNWEQVDGVWRPPGWGKLKELPVQIEARGLPRLDDTRYPLGSMMIVGGVGATFVRLEERWMRCHDDGTPYSEEEIAAVLKSMRPPVIECTRRGR